jgi:hypothetical protein
MTDWTPWLVGKEVVTYICGRPVQVRHCGRSENERSLSNSRYKNTRSPMKKTL